MNDLLLCPIEDVPDIWKEVAWTFDDGVTEYQCKRLSSLYKIVHPDGRVTYHDTRRVMCANYTGEYITWQNSFVTRLIDEIYPITMPYTPSNKPIMVYAKEFAFSKDSDGHKTDDTIGIFHADLPDGNVLKINRYFKAGAYLEDDWVEIDRYEFEERESIVNRRWRSYDCT